jgi:hypothetical protein
MTPADLRKYLESQGWAVLEAGIKDRLYVFDHADFPRRQLAYPMDMTAPDYDESVGGALLKLADITGRKIESLIAEIKMEMTRNDIINKLQAQGLRWVEGIAASPGCPVISQPPKPVGYWVLYPGITPKTTFAIYKRPTDEQIKNTEQLLGWGWEAA